MHIYSINDWKHTHRFENQNRAGERKIHTVIALTLTTMAAEITAGMFFGSMALLADGWHMGTHAVALGITAAAYFFARRHADDPRYTFGTGKIGVLGGFTSAVVLAVVALLMAAESIHRLRQPSPIRFNEAILVAFVGLAVNLVSARLLQMPHHHHDHHHHAPQDHPHQDHNMRGAYLHVLADAVTSILAIVALLAGKTWNWIWMDPLMGIVGAVIILKWAHGLLRDSGKILLDRDVDMKMIDTIFGLIEADADNRVADLHIWKIGSNQLAAIISVITHAPRPPDHYKNLLSGIQNLAHITVEVIHCTSDPCLPPQPQA